MYYAAKFTLDLKDIQYKGRAIGRSENLGGGTVLSNPKHFKEECFDFISVKIYTVCSNEFYADI